MERLRNIILSSVCSFLSHQKSCHYAHIRIVTVVGQEELDGRSVNVRNRDDVGSKAKTQMVPLDEIVEKLVALKNSKNLNNKLV